MDGQSFDAVNSAKVAALRVQHLRELFRQGRTAASIVPSSNADQPLTTQPAAPSALNPSQNQAPAHPPYPYHGPAAIAMPFTAAAASSRTLLVVHGSSGASGNVPSGLSYASGPYHSASRWPSSGTPPSSELLPLRPASSASSKSSLAGSGPASFTAITSGLPVATRPGGAPARTGSARAASSLLHQGRHPPQGSDSEHSLDRQHSGAAAPLSAGASGSFSSASTLAVRDGKAAVEMDAHPAGSGLGRRPGRAASRGRRTAGERGGSSGDSSLLGGVGTSGSAAGGGGTAASSTGGAGSETRHLGAEAGSSWTWAASGLARLGAEGGSHGGSSAGGSGAGGGSGGGQEGEEARELWREQQRRQRMQWRMEQQRPPDPLVFQRLQQQQLLQGVWREEYVPERLGDPEGPQGGSAAWGGPQPALQTRTPSRNTPHAPYSTTYTTLYSFGSGSRATAGTGASNGEPSPTTVPELGRRAAGGTAAALPYYLTAGIGDSLDGSDDLAPYTTLTRAAAVAQASAKLVAALGLSTFHMRPVQPSALRRPSPPAPARPTYMPDTGPAFESRLPVFVQANVVPPVQGQGRRRRWGAPAQGQRTVGRGAATAGAASGGGPSGSAVLSRTSSRTSSRGRRASGSGTASAAPEGRTPALEARPGSGDLGEGGLRGDVPVLAAEAAAMAAGAARDGLVGEAGLETSEGEVAAARVGGGAAGDAAGSGMEPATEPAESIRRPGGSSRSRAASQAGDSVRRREASRVSTTKAPGPTAMAATAWACRTASPDGDMWQGRLVYDMAGDVDVHLPDVRSVRPRAAMAAMGRSSRGLADAKAPVDERPHLDARDALCRKRAPSTSFAAPSYRSRTAASGASADRAGGDDRRDDDGRDQPRGRTGSDRRARRAWELPAGAVPAVDAWPNVDVAGSARLPSSTLGAAPDTSTSPELSGVQLEQQKRWGAGVSSPSPHVRDPGVNDDRSRSRSRSRGATDRRHTGTDGEDVAGDATQQKQYSRQVTAEALRGVPGLRFSRAARFPTSEAEENEDEDGGFRRRGRRGGAQNGAAESEGGGGAAHQRRRRRTRGEPAAGGADNAGEAMEEDAKPATAKAPLKLDAAYRAVLPRVSSAFISAGGPRIAWLPDAPAPKPVPQRRQRGALPDRTRGDRGPAPSGADAVGDGRDRGGAGTDAGTDTGTDAGAAGEGGVQEARSVSAPSGLRRGRNRGGHGGGGGGKEEEEEAQRRRLRRRSEGAGAAADGMADADAADVWQGRREQAAGESEGFGGVSGGDSEGADTDPGLSGAGAQSGQRRRRRRRHDLPLEPMAPLEGLRAAVNAVRPRAPAAGFAHPSVSEAMRKEVQARRERQLEKARQLQAQLRNQPVDELWPAVAAQLRRERLQALSRRRGRDRDPHPDQDQGLGGDVDMDDKGPAKTESSSGGEHRSRSSPLPGSSGWQALQQEATSAEAASPFPPLSPSAVVPGTPQRSRGPPLIPLQPPRAQSPDLLPRRGLAGAPAAAAATPGDSRMGQGQREQEQGLGQEQQRQSGAYVPVTRLQHIAAISPERPPHFLAATRATLSSLAPDGGVVGGDRPVGHGPAASPVAAAGGGFLSPSFALVEKRAPSVGFSPARPPAPAPRYSRQPGPGHYDLHLSDAAISRIARSPTPVFGTARRPVSLRHPDDSSSDGPESPTRHGDLTAAGEAAWLTRDPLAALDFTKRRTPGALILPEHTTAAAAGVGGGGDGSGEEGGEEGDGPMGLLDIRFTLVEPRVRGTPIMRKPPPSVVVEDDNGQPLERITGPVDPWAIDLAIRTRRPAWGFPDVGHAELFQHRPAGRGLLDLSPVYHLVERRVQGGVDFQRTPERNASEAERLRRLRRQPDGFEYDLDLAWAYLCKRAPQVIMHLAAPRWPAARRGADDDDYGAAGAAAFDEADPDASSRQRGRALLELSQALDYIRPRPPAWTFAPIVRVVRLDGPVGPRVRGFGPLLSFDVDISLVRRRLPGALPFGAGPPRLGLLDDRALFAARHLAPGYYEVDLAWRAALPAPRAADFAKGTGHDLLDDDQPFAAEDGGELPYGARLVLDVSAAKDATLLRRSRGPGPPMALALGRQEGRGDPAYEGRTAHLPLPDPDLDMTLRPRLRNAVLQGAPGHEPPAPEPSLHTALRGPGAYFPAGADQALALGPSARAVDFSRAPDRGLGESEVDAEEVLEGNRLVLSPHTALDYLRPRAPAAIIPPLHPDHHVHGSASYDLPYFHAVYDVDRGLDQARPRAPAPLGFGAMPGRDPSMAWPAGIDPPPAPYSRAVDMLGPDDVSLCQLSGFRRPPGAPNFAVAGPRMPEPAENYDGQRLDLRPDAARDGLRRQPPRPPDMARALGWAEAAAAAAAGTDTDLTAWLSYRPRFGLVRPALVGPLPLGLQIGRQQAARDDPRVGDNATGDLDGGVYRIRHKLVWRSAPAIDFGRAASQPRWAVPPGAVPSDPEAGNVLLLEPRQPQGWRPRSHGGSPTRQPFGRGEGRWERPGADPAYRFIAAVGDEGGALYLRHSADDLAALRHRATAANAPVAPWGWMTARRDAQVMQPDPARPPRPRAPPPAVPRVGGLLVRELPPPGAELEVLKHRPPNDPEVVAIRRRDRVLQRMVNKIKAQRAAAARI